MDNWLRLLLMDNWLRLRLLSSWFKDWVRLLPLILEVLGYLSIFGRIRMPYKSSSVLDPNRIIIFGAKNDIISARMALTCLFCFRSSRIRDWATVKSCLLQPLKRVGCVSCTPTILRLTFLSFLSRHLCIKALGQILAANLQYFAIITCQWRHR